MTITVTTDDDPTMIREQGILREVEREARRLLRKSRQFCEYKDDDRRPCTVPAEVWVAAKSQKQTRWYCNAHGLPILADLEAR